MERMLRDAINPAFGDGEIKIAVLHNIFDWLIVDARKRNLMDEPFAEVVDHCTSVHSLTGQLGCMVTFREGLRAAKADTALTDGSIKELLNEMKAHREWAVKHLDTMLSLPPPGTILN
jgi:hypothetical protein